MEQGRMRVDPFEYMTAHLRGRCEPPWRAQTRLLEWGSATCTALVTVRDVMSLGSAEFVKP